MDARKVVMATLAAFLLLLPGVSQAFWYETVNAQFDGSYDGYSGIITLDGNNENVYWTAFKAYSDAAQMSRLKYDLYCSDIPGPFQAGLHTYTVYSSWEPNPNLAPSYPIGGTPFGFRWASSLYQTYAEPYSNIGHGGNAAGRAALQLAIWEAIYDGSPGYAYGFSTGRFRVGSGAIQTAALGLLAATQSQGTAGYFDDGQNLIGDVPEPGTLMLLGGTLLGPALLALRRRRSS